MRPVVVRFGVAVGLLSAMSLPASATDSSVLRGAITIESSSSSGSAFCIAPRQYLSAAHVTDGSASMMATSWDGARNFRVTVVNEDSGADLALLRATGVCERVLPFATELPAPDDVVYAVGSPIGSPVLSEGVMVSVSDTELIARIAVAPGSSGGPLLNAADEVVGVVVQRDNLGNAYAVPFNKIQSFLSAAPTTSPTPTVTTVTATELAPTVLSLLALLIAVFALIIAIMAVRIARQRKQPIVITLQDT